MFHLSLHLLLMLSLSQSQNAVAAPPADPNRQIASIREIREIVLSPDAKTVASVITDATVAGGRPHIWILSENGSPRQITGMGAGSDDEESGPDWAPDGRVLLYLRKTGQATAVERIEPQGGHRETLALARHGAAVVCGWGADPVGKPVIAKGFALTSSAAVAVWASDPLNTQETAAKDDHLFGRSDPVRLHLIDDRSTSPREFVLTSHVRAVTVSDDGRLLLVITSLSSDDLGAVNRVWLIEEGQAPKEVRDKAENVQAVSWLPDGRIAYVARCSRNAPIVCRDLFVHALDGSKPRNLPDGIDGSLMNGVDNGSKIGHVFTASGDIVVTIARDFDQHLARLRPADGRVIWIISPSAVVKTTSINLGRTGLALLAAERGGIGTAQLADPNFRRYVRLASPDLQPADWMPLRSRRLEWVSDGRKIDGLLYLPKDAIAGQRVPLVVDAHGGPAGRFEDRDYPLIRLLLADAWAVLHVNPRGSFGYGTDFLASLQDDLGGADYRDIMSGVDAALAQAPLDKDRLALVGFSYGGTMASFALGRTGRFKALVAAAPVVDQISEYGTEGSSWYDRWYFGQPWWRLEAAWRQSPLAGVANARTPMLVLHGENDSVNPLGQSLEFYRAASPARITGGAYPVYSRNSS